MNIRPLKKIEADLELAFRREALAPIEIGRLLLEVKEQAGHGGWLPWLKAKFPHSVSTAENYMNAAKLAGKFPTVGNLKVTPGGLYALIEADNEGDTDVIEGALREAKTRWVDGGRVREIAKELHLPPAPPPTRPSDEPPPPAPPEPPPPEDDDDDDRPPPPSPPALKEKQARFCRDFDAAVAPLGALAAGR